MAQILAPRTRAPDFTLRVTPDQNLQLQDLAGKPVIIAFYPADWSPVCGDQLALYNEVLPEFRKHGAELLGISVDGVWCHAAYVQHRKRALFLLDKQGVVFWSHCSPLAVNPGADGILDALEKLSQEKDNVPTASSSHAG